MNPSFFIHLMAFSDFTRTMMKQISFSVEKPCYVTATRTMMAKSTTTNYECCLCRIIKSPSTTQASSRRTHPKMATLDISWSEDLVFFSFVVLYTSFGWNPEDVSFLYHLSFILLPRVLFCLIFFFTKCYKYEYISLLWCEKIKMIKVFQCK